jgi:competence protein ComFB
MAPLYIVSNRGLASAEQQSLAYQQKTIDIDSIVSDALKTVRKNQRPNRAHDIKRKLVSAPNMPLFALPAIVGRAFSGQNFEPVNSAEVVLLEDGVPVAMVNNNWQNPCPILKRTAGVYTFWPAPVWAEAASETRIFKYSVIIRSEGMETLQHHFELPVMSALTAEDLFHLDKTFKLPDLFLFPVGAKDADD